jgi:cytochrome c oxidase cbb3-type subunit 4
MDGELINTLRSIVIIFGLACFAGICCWSWSKHAKTDFDEAARLPLPDDDLPAQPADKEGMTNG